VIGIEEEGEMKINPLSTTKIVANSKLLVLGNTLQIEKLTEIVKEGI
jgi:K+/H+ antiporter YhaU regulatory subunit KhtT